MCRADLSGKEYVKMIEEQGGITDNKENYHALEVGNMAKDGEGKYQQRGYKVFNEKKEIIPFLQ